MRYITLATRAHRGAPLQFQRCREDWALFEALGSVWAARIAVYEAEGMQLVSVRVLIGSDSMTAWNECVEHAIATMFPAEVAA